MLEPPPPPPPELVTTVVVTATAPIDVTLTVVPVVAPISFARVVAVQLPEHPLEYAKVSVRPVSVIWNVTEAARRAAVALESMLTPLLYAPHDPVQAPIALPGYRMSRLETP